MPALNGIVEGDQLLEIDGNTFTILNTAITALANLYDRFGRKCEIKIIEENEKSL